MSIENSESVSSTSTSPTMLPTPFHTSKPIWNPHPYQKRAIEMMLQQACVALFLDPGLGKTAVSLAAFKLLKKAGYVKRMLVIAPLRPCYSVWPGEITKWANFGDLRFAIIHGPDRKDVLDLDADVYIMNVDNTKWLFKDNLHKKIKADILCVDESTKFKSSSSHRFQAIKHKLDAFKRRWILTGTPAPNGLINLFSQVYLLDQGATLTPYITRFRMTYFIQSGYGGYDWMPLPHAMETIAEKIAPLVLRLKAEDYLEMPELQLISIPVELPDDAREAYQRMEDQFYLEMQSGEVVAANQAVAGGKCRQICNGRVYDANRNVHDIHTAKLEAYENLVEELSGQPVLVLYEFKHDVEAMQRRVAGPNLGAGGSPKKSKAIEDSFNAGLLPVVYGHPASVGYGLNLQEAAHHIIFYGITWDLELYDQAISRIWRQGQKAKTVFVYHIVATRTLDEKVLKVLRGKDHSQKSLLEAFTRGI